MQSLVVLGQTATGKSAAAIEIAKALSGEVLSADSMQVYRGMDIGTAKPSLKERQGIPHHLIDIRDPDEAWTVADFVKEVTGLVPAIQKRKHLPIIVGGTGLYLWSLLEGFSFPHLAADPALRKELEQKTAEALHRELEKIDPVSAAKIHPNNKKRVIRALEVFKLTATSISAFNQSNVAAPIGSGPSLLFIGLTLPREELYERIDQRVDQMIENGLVAEVEALLKKGYSKKLPALEALGYKEIIEYLEGKIKLEEAVELIKKGTRNFAKRQMTWFRRFKDVTWIANHEPLTTKRKILLFLENYHAQL